MPPLLPFVVLGCQCGSEDWGRCFSRRCAVERSLGRHGATHERLEALLRCRARARWSVSPQCVAGACVRGSAHERAVAVGGRSMAGRGRLDVRRVARTSPSEPAAVQKRAHGPGAAQAAALCTQRRSACRAIEANWPHDRTGVAAGSRCHEKGRLACRCAPFLGPQAVWKQFCSPVEGLGDRGRARALRAPLATRMIPQRARASLQQKPSSRVLENGAATLGGVSSRCAEVGPVFGPTLQRFGKLARVAPWFPRWALQGPAPRRARAAVVADVGL